MIYRRRRSSAIESLAGARVDSAMMLISFEGRASRRALISFCIAGLGASWRAHGPVSHFSRFSLLAKARLQAHLLAALAAATELRFKALVFAQLALAARPNSSAGRRLASGGRPCGHSTKQFDKAGRTARACAADATAASKPDHCGWPTCGRSRSSLAHGVSWR